MSMFNKIKIAAAALAAIALVGCSGSSEKKAPAAPQQAAQQAAEQRPLIRPTAVPQLTQVVTKTESQVMACVIAGLTADGRTFAQAKHMRGTDDVTIEGVKSKLGDGNSYYSRCRGPTLEARLTAATENQEALSASLVSANSVINEWRPWVFVNPRGTNTLENTWKGQFRLTDDRLISAQKWDWGQNALIFVFFFLSMFLLFRKHIFG